MRVVRLGCAGVKPALPVKALHPARGGYLRFEHGEEGRGRKLVFFPLGARDFPSVEEPPPQETEYRLVPVSEGRAYILGRGSPDGQQLVLWSLAPGFRGGATYSVSGDAAVIAEGYEAQGDAGRMGGAPCPVLIVKGPCVLRWSRSGRLYGTPADWRATYDGRSWVVEPDSAEADAVAIALG